MGEVTWGFENKDRYLILNKVKKAVLLERHELKGMFIKSWVTKIIAAAVWVSVIGLLHGGQKKRTLQLLRHKITESPCGRCMGDPSAILEGNEMSGQNRECHIYCWMKGFNWSGWRQDIECLHKGTATKVPPLIHVSGKCLLKGKTQNWASGTLNRDHPWHSLCLPPPPLWHRPTGRPRKGGATPLSTPK